MSWQPPKATHYVKWLPMMSTIFDRATWKTGAGSDPTKLMMAGLRVPPLSLVEAYSEGKGQQAATSSIIEPMPVVV